MENLFLTNVEFARTIFKASGKCPDGTKKDRFFLCKRETDEMISILDTEVSQGTFSLEIPMLSCRDERPLSSGSWYLCFRSEDGSQKPLYVSNDLYDRIYQYVEPEQAMDLTVDKSAKNYFHAYSRLCEEDFSYYLKVEFKVPHKTRNIFKVWARNVKRRNKSRLRTIRKWVFSSAFRFFNKHITKNGKRVLFTSDSRAEIGGNEAFVYNRMKERGLDHSYEIHFDFKEKIGARRSLKNKILFTYYLATSDYIFVDDYQPEIYQNEYDPNVKIIQLWHACGAFKTVGFERLGAKGAPAFNTRNHKCYTHVMVSSEHSARHNAEAFALNRSKFYPTGVPRTDIFFDEEYKKDVRERMRKEFPRVRTADQVILYAPTFRGQGQKSAYFPMHILHLKKIGTYLKASNSVMIIKMHPFVRNELVIPEEYADYFIDASNYREVNDILFITDLMITDYSSVIYEASLLNIPMLFYAFDLDQYIAERGFYEPYENIVPGKIVKTLPALLRALEEKDYESEKLQGFVEKNFKYTDGRSTDRVIDLIFGVTNAG